MDDVKREPTKYLWSLICSGIKLVTRLGVWTRFVVVRVGERTRLLDLKGLRVTRKWRVHVT